MITLNKHTEGFPASGPVPSFCVDAAWLIYRMELPEKR